MESGTRILFLALISIAFAAQHLPVVLIHGISANKDTLNHVKDLVEANIPGVYVRNLEIGDGKHHSWAWTLNKQVDFVCDELSKDPLLKDGFNLWAVSQGGLISRGYIERCNNPPVYNFVSWLAPQAGVYGVPEVTPDCLQYLHNSSFCHFLESIMDTFCYQSWVQGIASFPGYWVDPFKLDTYVQKSVYLADIDNLRPQKNETYRRNMLGLHRLLLVHSTKDKVIYPHESTMWATFAPKSRNVIRPLQETEMYQKDWIGLRTLAESGRLRVANSTIAHNDYVSATFDKEFLPLAIPILAAN